MYMYLQYIYIYYSIHSSIALVCIHRLQVLHGRWRRPLQRLRPQQTRVPQRGRSEGCTQRAAPGVRRLKFKGLRHLGGFYYQRLNSRHVGIPGMLWMVATSILHQTETMVETSFCWYIYREVIVPGFLRWCRISSIHSSDKINSFGVHIPHLKSPLHSSGEVLAGSDLLGVRNTVSGNLYQEFRSDSPKDSQEQGIEQNVSRA